MKLLKLGSRMPCLTKYNASQQGLNFKIPISLSVFNEIIPKFNINELVYF